MARVLCRVDRRQLQNENYREVDGVIVTCGKCNHEEQAFGSSERSVKRCLVSLRENCPLGEENYYDEEPLHPQSP